MKIIKSTETSETHWTARKLVEMIKDEEINFNIDIQRGFVWRNNDKRSALIGTMIRGKSVPPLYFNKIDNIYEGSDGKQRAFTILKFMNDEFKLSGLDEFTVVNDEGGIEEIALNGLKFSELDECFKNAIKEYNFMICFTVDADADEVADTFYNLNNGQTLNAATMNRVKAKSKEQINRLSKHKVFQDSLSNVALEGHVNDDLVAKAHAILNDEEVSTDAKWIRPYMRKAIITDEDEILLNEVFDRIYNIHTLIDDKKIAKRIYARTHMISIVPIIVESINSGYSDKQMMEWFVNFFCGKKSPTMCKSYNDAAGRGTGKNSAIRKRLEEIKKDYDKYFENVKTLVS